MQAQMLGLYPEADPKYFLTREQQVKAVPPIQLTHETRYLHELGNQEYPLPNNYQTIPIVTLEDSRILKPRDMCPILKTYESNIYTHPEMEKVNKEYQSTVFSKLKDFLPDTWTQPMDLETYSNIWGAIQ